MLSPDRAEARKTQTHVFHVNAVNKPILKKQQHSN